MASSDDGQPPAKQAKKAAHLPQAAAAIFKHGPGPASSHSRAEDWSPNGYTGPLPPTCLSRVTRELLDLVTNPLPGIAAVQDEDDLGRVHALLIGPSGTPYQGGFFYLVLRVTEQYPMQPPKAQLMTTGSGQVRFNPNLYKNGKVCLSILGTWEGPCWTPAMGLRSVLLSVQSLMNEKPYRNEPGFASASVKKCDEYNDIVQHETLRVAVCEMMEGRVPMPQLLRQEMRSAFGQHYQYYTDLCRRHINRDGKPMRDPFNPGQAKFSYGSVLKRLESVNQQLSAGAGSS
ncbi:hypothetical protein BOX15_Mlig016234g1 [Macrostomum lignano]|uniref:Ubiquitin-conjugating enzyme E2 Z n=2 Tax=Macrostomum lignano TaxID=282301 RepID=A0A1I8H3J1_9PLAT|nr:hypothetical protein BOX15_Mlig016234g1 [Macrostomum lignano]